MVETKYNLYWNLITTYVLVKDIQQWEFDLLLLKSIQHYFIKIEILNNLKMINVIFNLKVHIFCESLIY